MSLISLLVMLIVFCVIIWAARAILAAFAVPDPIRTVVWVVIVLLCVFALIDQTGLVGSTPFLRLR